MRLLIFLSLLICVQVLHAQQTTKANIRPAQIAVAWVDKPGGDFSFINKWDYPEGVYKNDYGEVSCDGLCPPEVESMKDTNGRVYPDSLAAFYRIVDTAHMYHSIECEARCYEFGEANYINVIRHSKESVYCYTMCNASTHSSLCLEIVNGHCKPVIKLNSIVNHKRKHSKVFNCKGGYINIDRRLWKQGIMKAEFSFDFVPDKKGEPIYWKGRVYKKME